jgi:hypothetical protein
LKSVMLGKNEDEKGKESVFRWGTREKKAKKGSSKAFYFSVREKFAPTPAEFKRSIGKVRGLRMV